MRPRCSKPWYSSTRRRWSNVPGGPRRETRSVTTTSLANPRAAPQSIHGELLKLGIEVRPGGGPAPSAPSRRSANQRPKPTPARATVRSRRTRNFLTLGLKTATSGVTGQVFSSKINDELPLFGAQKRAVRAHACQPNCLLPKAFGQITRGFESRCGTDAC